MTELESLALLLADLNVQRRELIEDNARLRAELEAKASDTSPV